MVNRESLFNVRIGFCINKKIANSVQRNRVRRIFKEIFRKVDVKESIDVVIKANKRVVDETYWILKEKIEDALKQYIKFS